jgi:hypothetical protein
MSRQGPFGFGLSVLFEIAAIVAIVSLLPKFDLRPSASAEAGSLPAVEQPNVISPVGWMGMERPRDFESRPAANYPPQIASSPSVAPAGGSFPTREASPLIEVEAQRPQYVEQRLDRASQRLVNGVGTAVADAHNWLRVPAPPGGTREFRSTATQQPQPRPWIRY